MKALILTEGSVKIGYGHITRCIALAHAMNAMGVNTEFLVNADKLAESVLRKEKINYLLLDWKKNKKKVLLSLYGKEMAIIDSYLAGPDFYDFVYTSNPLTHVIAIDDYNRIDYSTDVLINPSISGNKTKYKKHHNVVYLLGKDYIILRKEFWNIPEKRIKKNIKDVLITLGGIERHGFLLKMLWRLRLAFPYYTYHVVTPSRIDITANKGIRQYLNLSACEMRELALKADVAVSGGGQTLYELARLGVPTIGIRFSENQKINMKGLHKEGFLKSIFYYKNKGILNNIVSAVFSLQRNNVRRNRSRIGKNLIDGSGANRIAKTLASLKDTRKKFYLRPAKIYDCNDILSWRNHKEVRRWSFNSKAISYEDHKKWFTDVIKSKNKKIYIAVNGAGENLGQIRIDMNSSNRGLINVNLNPIFFGKGLGSKIISMGTRLLLKKNPHIEKILAEVISTNIASRRAFKRAGYVLSGYRVKNNKRIAVFEYKRLRGR